jgi:acyl-CoA reductase-like NAD-dependent aldehyde dehydrogenase
MMSVTDTSNEAKIVSPIDGSIYAQIPYTQNDAIQSALLKAQTAQAEWAKAPISFRAKLCRSFIAHLVGQAPTLGEELTWQMGRPIAYTPKEISGGFKERADYMIEIAPEALADFKPLPKADSERFIRPMPLGVVFVIAAWNYPYLIAVNSIIPALMAGNSVLLKHAQQTLLVGEALAMSAQAVGFPEGLFTHLVLTHEQSSKLIGAPEVAHVSFTGSVAGGRAVQASAQNHFINVGLELGGKDPAYVRADADLETAVNNLVDGGFFNSGQSCCGIERIYVDESIYNAFLECAVSVTQKYKLGNPLNPTTTLGPVINKKAAENIQADIDAACHKGATALINQEQFQEVQNPTGTYMAPQILINVDHSMRIMSEETFGPVIGIMPVKNDDQAIQLMNDSPYGLTASVWTQDRDAALAIGTQIKTGTFFMNRCDYLDPALGWSGVGDTGRGVTLSHLGYGQLTRPMSFNFNLGA